MNFGSVKRAELKRLKLLGNTIRELRLEQDLSQSQLAFETEITIRQLGRIERGETNPSFLVLYRISEALDIPLSELLKDL